MIVGEARRALLVVALVAILASCSDGASTGPTTPTAIPTTVAPTMSPTLSSAAPSPSPSPSASSAKPVLPDAAKQPTADGAEEFLKFYWANYNYSLQTLDSSTLPQLAEPTCKYCQKVLAAISNAKVAGYAIFGGSVEPLAVVAAPGEAKRGLLVNAKVRQNAQVTRDSRGVVVTQFAAAEHGLEAAVRWSGTAWKIVEMRTVN